MGSMSTRVRCFIQLSDKEIEPVRPIINCCSYPVSGIEIIIFSTIIILIIKIIKIFLIIIVIVVVVIVFFVIFILINFGYVALYFVVYSVEFIRYL